MNPLEYLHLQLRLEGKEIIRDNLLRQVEIVPGEDMPWLVIGFLANRQRVAYYDEALPSELRETLDLSIQGIEFPQVSPIVDVLHSRGFDVNVDHYKTYIFEEGYKFLSFDEVKRFSKRDLEVQAFGFDDFAEEVYGIERDGRIVSACVSTRENDSCGEAWVFTDGTYRHQGFAQKVVGAWAASLIAASKVPFYSYRIDNPASASLAQRLGLQPVFEEIVISE